MAYEELERPEFSDLAIRRINTHRDIIELQVLYSVYRAACEGSEFLDALLKYSRFQKILKKLSREEAIELEERMLLIDVSNLDPKTIQGVVFDIFHHSLNLRAITSTSQHPCFTYTTKGDAAHIHFSNATIPQNPLAKREIGYRREELRNIALDISTKHPEINVLIGGSWLYHLTSYLQLFPQETTTNRTPISTSHTGNSGYWGQFYRYDGSLNHERANEFRRTWEFPLQPISTWCPIGSLYRMYLS